MLQGCDRALDRVAEEMSSWCGWVLLAFLTVERAAQYSLASAAAAHDPTRPGTNDESQLNLGYPK
jgi:hypothetical protein